MIVLNVTYMCKRGKREAFLKLITAEGIDAASRADEGNIQYDYFIPTDGSDDLFLLEKLVDWNSDAWVIARLKTVKAEFVVDTIIEKYMSTL